MIKSFTEIDNSLINEICENFENDYDFDHLKEKYSMLDYNVLYSVLYSTGKYNKKIHNYLCQNSINDKKILIISDTHYGSIFENMNYTYDVFDFAYKNGIHTILHGGDIIESNVKPRKKLTNIKQADYFINKYPFDSTITTYALLGNHDYLAIKQNSKVMNTLSCRKDVKILGYKKVYLNWCKNVISLHHKIDDFKLNLPVYAEHLSFKGHSHFYHIKEKDDRKVYIPALCDDESPKTNLYLCEKKLDYKPGFLTAEIDNEVIIVNRYSIKNNIISKENEYIKSLKKCNKK